MDIGSCGCHAVAWNGESDIPHLTTSKTYTLTESDLSRLADLRKLIRNDAEKEGTESHEPAQEAEAAKESPVRRVTQVEPVVVEESGSNSVPKKKRHSSEDIANAMDIPKLGSKFFNWYAQVLGVYKGKGEPFTVFVRAWDGTRPRFPAYRNMFHADKDSIDTVYCDISPQLYFVIDSCTVDICLYGDWARKASSFQVRDIIYLCNIRNYTSQTNGISAITMHEGGLQFGRALEVLDESNPKHFEISKQCADTLSRYLGASTFSQNSSSVVNMTPILPENVMAQSTPMFSKNSEAVDENSSAGTSKQPHGSCIDKDYSSDSSTDYAICEVCSVIAFIQLFIKDEY
ncbi:unnamed protein product [Strongylus vulgaris]|uniref:Protection of telomeres protein 1 ssDNA-binding domain-containing protein n=1 Tax=Strongylus vulgaris TaxID=40348 RepID=A0A3P7I253_STRVU|nr:unnamed protein product [Strongylus vulgaris]